MQLLLNNLSYFNHRLFLGLFYAKCGMWDIFIVFLYTALIYSREYIDLFLAIFPAIFIFYIIGGIFRNKEYGETVSNPKLSLKYFILFLLTFMIYLIWPQFMQCFSLLSLLQISWILLFLNLVLLICYRVEREMKRRNAAHCFHGSQSDTH